MGRESCKQHWTQEEVGKAIAKALENEPEGPNKEYWTTDLTVDAVKRKYHTTKFKPTPLKIVLVRRCCGEKFTHVLANKRKANGLSDWRCLDPQCLPKTLVMPFGKFKGESLSWVYEQEPSYLAWFTSTSKVTRTSRPSSGVWTASRPTWWRSGTSSDSRQSSDDRRRRRSRFLHPAGSRMADGEVHRADHRRGVRRAVRRGGVIVSLLPCAAGKSRLPPAPCPVARKPGGSRSFPGPRRWS